MINPGVIKEIGSVLIKAGNMDLYEKIYEFQKALIDLSEENKELKEKNSMLEEKLRIKESLEVINDCYYTKRSDGDLDGPYCTVCYDKCGDLIRMHKVHYYYQQNGLECKVCKSIVSR